MKKNMQQGKAGAALQNNSKGNRQPNADNNAGNSTNEDSLFEKFFMEQLKDIYYTERKLMKALSYMEEAATTEELKEAFSDHQYQTMKQSKRLEKVFQLLGHEAEAKKCEAIEGLLRECDSIIQDTQEGSMTRDAALIMAAQKIEHYEIATYGGLVQFAITMGKVEVAQLLDKTLMEEEETDFNLTEIAESFINIEAEEETKYSWNRKQEQEA